MKKVLITGGSGLLGQYLNLSLTEKFKIYTTYFNNSGNCLDYSNVKTDIRKEKEIENLFSVFQPDFVIHSAAITNPIPKENQSAKEYFDTNVTATKYIAKLCSKFNSKMIYISTDLVYAGYRGSFLKEDGKLIPATLYAETKLVGENKVKEFTNNYLILRAALLFGFGLNHSKCHFHFMHDELKKNRPVKLFTDQYRTPVSLIDISKLISELIDIDIKAETINIGGAERVSRFELGEMLCSIAGFDKNLLQKISMDKILDFPKVEDVSLNIEKIVSLGLKPRSIEENISELVINK